MKITIIGTGYVGLVAGLCFADFGNDVTCLDTDEKKINLLKKGNMPIYEVGAEEILKRNLNAQRIRFTTDAKFSIQWADVIFIAVGTPSQEDGEADLTYIINVAESISKYADRYKVVVDKSTVPVGTSKKIEKIIKTGLEDRKCEFTVDVVSNPEFLREGKAIGDFLNPDRIIIGTNSKSAEEILLKIYKVFDRSNKPIMVTNPETAEMIKYASNAFLATKITFINEIAELCEKVGANVLDVAKAMGQDGRISPKFLHPGPGYGGSCFPKDTKAIVKTAKDNNVKLSIIENVISANEYQKKRCADKVKERLEKGTIAILGIAFKPETDDVRESSALRIVDELLACKKYKLNLYDPKARKQGERYFPNSEFISWKENVYDAIFASDAVLLITEWLEFRSLDFEKVRSIMSGNLFFDFRNVYNKEDLVKFGLEYFGTGV